MLRAFAASLAGSRSRATRAPDPDPAGAVIEANDGNLYGLTRRGGEFDEGVLYRITPNGEYTILYGFNNAVVFSYDAGLPPFVKYLPVYGQVGTTVEILGQGFNADTSVQFNGIAAQSVVVYPTYLKAIVPVGATTGPITVSTAQGTLQSDKIFVVHP